MPVRTLDGWLVERGLVKDVPLAALAGTRIGIDANNYIRRILANRDPTTSDTFVAAVGGAPLALTGQVEKDLQALEKAGVKPVFVFSGISLVDKERPFVADDQKTWRRNQGWDNYENGRVPQAQAEFGASSPVVPADVVRVVHRLFKMRHVEFVVAPYLAWAQLAYLERHDKQYVHSVYGPTEMFMFEGIDRVILNIDFDSSTLTYASKTAIMTDVNVTNEQFLDVCILSGYDGCSPFPAIDPREFSFRGAVDLVKSRGSGVSVVMSYKDFPPVFPYVDQFARARCSIKFSLVLVAQEGRVLPLPIIFPPPAPQPTITAADVPADLGEIFSPHFPDEVYYQLFRGLVGPSTINALASGRVTEATPLCGGTPEYERYVKALTEPSQSPRCIAIALVSSVLHPIWAKKPVSAVYYFDPNNQYPIPHSSPVTTATIESVSKWNVDARYVENELRRQVSSTIDLSLCLGGTSSSALAQRTIIPKNSEKLLEKKDEIVANTLWRFLELRAFLTSAHQHTAYAQALYLAMRSSKVNDKFQESLYLAIELLRANALHNGRIGTRAYSGGPNFNGTDEDKRSMLLVMRVLSIVPLSFNPGPWTGPLSRELLVFNSFLRVTTRSMRGLLEAVAMNLLLRSDARRSREDYLDIALSLPFQNDTNTGMGILFKAYGDAFAGYAGGVDVICRAGAGTTGATEEEKATVAEARDSTFKLLDEFFPNVKNVTGELQRGLRFWQMIMLAVRSLRSYPGGAISPELAAQFEAADAWLKPFAIVTP
ncbi:XPG I-region protein [Pseudohyphozyma bogoriensis]|nr:XPG I-region protein [Pseudohyphozyma bogoriensis]